MGKNKKIVLMFSPGNWNILKKKLLNNEFNSNALALMMGITIDQVKSVHKRLSC